jgi:hypothetical protein
MAQASKSINQLSRTAQTLQASGMFAESAISRNMQAHQVGFLNIPSANAEYVT